MTGEHLSTDTVADHLEGLLDPAEQDAVDAHLRTCSTCARLRAEVASVSTLLAGSAAEDIPVPEAVADRVQGAIQAESDRRARGGGVASLEAARHRQPHRQRRWSPRAGRALAAVAGLVVLVGGGAFAVQQLSGTGSSPLAGKPDSASSGGQAAGGSAAGSPRATATPDLTAATFAAAARSAVAAERHPASAAPTESPGKPGKPVKPGKPGKPGVEPSRGSVPKSFQGPNGFGADPVARCVARAVSHAAPSGSTQRLLASEPARWQGQRVVLAVAAPADRGRTARAYAVSGCPDAARIVHEQQIRLPAER